MFFLVSKKQIKKLQYKSYYSSWCIMSVLNANIRPFHFYAQLLKLAQLMCHILYIFKYFVLTAAAAAKSLQSCLTLCDPIDGSPPGSPIPGILQARTLEWVAISFSNTLKWKVKGNSVASDSSRPHGLQPTRLLHPWDFLGKSTGVGCHPLFCYKQA